MCHSLLAFFTGCLLEPLKSLDPFPSSPSGVQLVQVPEVLLSATRRASNETLALEVAAENDVPELVREAEVEARLRSIGGSVAQRDFLLQHHRSQRRRNQLLLNSPYLDRLHQDGVHRNQQSAEGDIQAFYRPGTEWAVETVVRDDTFRQPGPARIFSFAQCPFRVFSVPFRLSRLDWCCHLCRP